MVAGIAGAALSAAGVAGQSRSSAQDLGGTGFADVLEKALGAIEQEQAEAGDLMAAFIRGEDVDLHEVMAAAEEAGLALELLVEMRNKFVDAYRTIVSMQV